MELYGFGYSPNADADASTNADPDTNSDSNTDAYAGTNSDPNTYAGTDANANPNTNTDANSDTNAATTVISGGSRSLRRQRTGESRWMVNSLRSDSRGRRSHQQSRWRSSKNKCALREPAKLFRDDVQCRGGQAVSTMDQGQSTERLLGQRFCLGTVFRKCEQQRRAGISDRHDLGYGDQPRGLLGMWTERLGLAGQRLGRRSVRSADILPIDGHTDHTRAKP